MDIQNIINHFFQEIPPNPSYDRYTKLLEQNGMFALLEPETVYEADLITRPDFIEGLMWGLPRYGHPEGRVAYHIREVFHNIDHLKITNLQTRQMLRTIALLHDTFKYKEDRNIPRDWSKHHGVLARKYIEHEMVGVETCEIIELHDEAFYAWRAEVVEKNEEESRRRIEKIENRIPNYLEVYFQFFLCDTLTGDKLRTPVKWLYEKGIFNNWFKEIT